MITQNKDNKARPPAWADQLLEWFCSKTKYEEIKGDLEEEFNSKLKLDGMRKARFDYVRNVFGFLKTLMFSNKFRLYSKDNFFNPKMYFHSITLAFRNFTRNRVYAVAVVLSLAVGFAISNVLIGFIIHELNTDNFINNKERIYRVMTNIPFWFGKRSPNAEEARTDWLAGNAVEYIGSHYPEIESMCRMMKYSQEGISAPGKDKISGLKILAVDSTFFKIFNFPLYRGNPNQAINKDKIILTVNSAQKLFGPDFMNADQVEILNDTSKVIKYISGFIDLRNENTHLQFDGLVYLGKIPRYGSCAAYVLLQPGVLSKQFVDKINGTKNIPNNPGISNSKYYLEPLKNIYLDAKSSGLGIATTRNKLFLWVSLSVTILVLLLSVFNFLNLFTILFIKRWKEFGLKKILGATRNSIRLIALTEVSLYVIFSFILSIILSYTLLPFFDNLITSGLNLNYLIHPEVIGILSLVVFLISVIAIYKLAHHLYRIKSVSLLSNKKAEKLRISHWMLGLQFIISIILVTVSIVIIRQVNYINTIPLGFNRNLLEIQSPSASFNKDLEFIKNDLSSNTTIKSSSICNGNPVSNMQGSVFKLENGEFFTAIGYCVDEDYLKTLGLNLVEGNLPNPENDQEVLVNQEFVRHFDMKNPIGMEIPGSKTSYEKPLYISGVITDFIEGSLRESKLPAIIYHIGQPRGMALNPNKLEINYNPNNLEQIIPLLKNEWQKYFNDFPFQYTLTEDALRKNHARDITFSRMVISTSLASILITCFGLFAISWGMAKDRSKEIGIRKVIGASVSDVMNLLLRIFIKWILIAYFIALPVAWWLSQKWLERFAEKVVLNVWTFTVAVIIIIFITFISIGYQMIRSAMTNPVEELKYE